jgi:integrase
MDDVMEEIDDLINNLNLKLSGLHVSLRRRNQTIYLRATLPPKNNSKRNWKHQQEISLHLKALPENLQQAEVEAYKLAMLISEGNFKWDIYDKKDLIQPTISELILRFEENYFHNHQRQKSGDTYKNDYLTVFRHLPDGEILSPGLLKKFIQENSPPDTRKRRRYVLALDALSRFAGVDADIRSLIGEYSPRKVKPRNLPTEKSIVECYQKIENAGWRWVYGMMATYGLRNHEVFRIDFELLREGTYIASVVEGKTGERRVWPFYHEWVEQFKLNNVVLPDCNLERSNSSLGHQVTTYFKRNAKLPFNPYSLRHCWAIRTLKSGLDISLAAQQMGHSLQVHSTIYHRWINDIHHQKAYDSLLSDEKRPRSPS